MTPKRRKKKFFFSSTEAEKKKFSSRIEVERQTQKSWKKIKNCGNLADFGALKVRQIDNECRGNRVKVKKFKNFKSVTRNKRLKKIFSLRSPTKKKYFF